MRGTPAVARLSTLLLFLALAGISAYWILQIMAPRPAIAPSGSIGDSTAATNLAPSAQLFGRAGDAPQQTAAPSNIQVTGIAESGPRGVAILTVDGRPAVAYAVNDTVADGTRLVAVSLDTVTLDQRGRKLELKAPERGSLSVLSSGVGKPRTTSSAATAPPVSATPPPPPAQGPAQSPASDPGSAGRPGLPPAGMTPQQALQAGQSGGLPPGQALGTPSPSGQMPQPSFPGPATAAQPGAAPMGIPPGVTPNLPPGLPAPGQQGG